MPDVRGISRRGSLGADRGVQRKQRSIPALALGLLASQVVGCAPSEDAPQAEAVAQATPINVLLIVVDTLRKDHLGCYGYERETSPHIDRLAGEAVVYSNAVSQAPWTTPSLGALMTSQYPSTLGIWRDQSVLPERYVTLAEALTQAGFDTAAIVSHDFCSSDWNFDQGFASFDESQIKGHYGVSSPEISERAIEFLDARGPQPFFLWLHYFDVHWRYRIHEGFEFGAGEDYGGVVREGMPFHELRESLDLLTERDIDEVKRQYDSEIAFTDHHIGRVLERLRELELYQDTLIIFVSDHGEEFKEHGDLGHAHSLYSEVVGIPLIVRYPGAPPATVTRPVSAVDVYPTVLEALGLEPHEVGLETALVGSPLPRTSASEAHAPPLVFTETTRRGALRAAIQWPFKLIFDVTSGQYELYDLALDSSETQNVFEERGSEVSELRESLDRWTEEHLESARSAGETELNAEDLEELRALGYGGEGD